MALAAYRELLDSRRGEMLARGTPAFYRQTVAGTFCLAYDRVLERYPTAAEVLGMCAFLGADDIPTELLASDDPLADEDTIAALRRLGLVRRDGDSIAVHRLVGAVIREHMAADDAARGAKAAVAALCRAFPDPADAPRSWHRSWRLLPHVLAVAKHAEETHELGRLLNLAAGYLRSRGQPRPACEVLGAGTRDH